MRRAIVTVVALLSACIADSGGAGSSELIGTWAIDGGDCVAGLAFDHDEYQASMGCWLDTGELGLQAIRGQWSADPNRLTLVPEISSCADIQAGPETIRYDVDGDTLTLRGADGVLVYQRLPEASGGSGVALYGCYDDEGIFEQRDLQPVQPADRR